MNKKSSQPAQPGAPTGSEILLYQTEDEQTRIEVRLDGGTVWLSQRMLADLYQVTVPTINEHLGNIYAEKELEPGATIRKFRIVQTEGGRAVTRRAANWKTPRPGRASRASINWSSRPKSF